MEPGRQAGSERPPDEAIESPLEQRLRNLRWLKPGDAVRQRTLERVMRELDADADDGSSKPSP
jgi:hypothetical protein